MFRYEEDELLANLESNPKLLPSNLSLRILHRKLKYRKQLRVRHLPVFDFDAVVRRLAGKSSGFEPGPSESVSQLRLCPQILDRFQVSGLKFFELISHFVGPMRLYKLLMA